MTELALRLVTLPPELALPLLGFLLGGLFMALRILGGTRGE